MPAALWAAAIILARQHGLYTTARGLRVDYGSLKKRLDGVGAGRVPSPPFVELPPARPTNWNSISTETKQTSTSCLR
jgi:hypothetical protein